MSGRIEWEAFDELSPTLRAALHENGCVDAYAVLGIVRWGYSEAAILRHIECFQVDQTNEQRRREGLPPVSLADIRGSRASIRG